MLTKEQIIAYSEFEIECNRAFTEREAAFFSREGVLNNFGIKIKKLRLEYETLNREHNKKSAQFLLDFDINRKEIDSKIIALDSKEKWEDGDSSKRRDLINGLKDLESNLIDMKLKHNLYSEEVLVPMWNEISKLDIELQGIEIEEGNKLLATTVKTLNDRKIAFEKLMKAFNE